MLPNDDSLDGEYQSNHPEIVVAGSNLPISRPNKRRREDTKMSDNSPSKIQATTAARTLKSQPSAELRQGVHEAEELPHHPPRPTMPHVSSHSYERAIAPGVRHTRLRQVLQYVVNEGLKVGGRPESAIARETSHGEIIEVFTRSANGEPRIKHIEWYVDETVQETMLSMFQTKSLLPSKLWLTLHSR